MSPWDPLLVSEHPRVGGIRRAVLHVSQYGGDVRGRRAGRGMTSGNLRLGPAGDVRPQEGCTRIHVASVTCPVADSELCTNGKSVTPQRAGPLYVRNELSIGPREEYKFAPSAIKERLIVNARQEPVFRRSWQIWSCDMVAQHHEASISQSPEYSFARLPYHNIFSASIFWQR